jgi:predicted  nucleic acid-binding Zn-ribbon protein
MNEEEKRYSKKPKAILIMDCVYLDSERKRLNEELRRSISEVEKQKRDFDAVRKKNVALQDAISGLAQAITALKHGVGV